MLSRYEDDVLFIGTVIRACRGLRCVTAVRLLADIYDLDDGENVRWSQKMRFEIANFEDLNELKESMLEYMSQNTAPVWHRLSIDETSDKGYNKLVKYHRDYFDFCIQRPSKSGKQVTTICGEKEIHPGTFIKVITDHNIVYRTNDCLIQCLNEVLDRREDPVTIRKEIWPEGHDYERDIHRTRHIIYIAKRYDTKILLSDLIEQKNLIYNGGGTHTVKMVKVGKVLGVLDRIDYTVDKRNISKDVAYFDLETVGPDQRVYAFTWRHKDGDMTICHNNTEDVEIELAKKILETLEEMGDDDTAIAYAWNGSRFDNWIIMNIMKRKFNKRLWVHDIIINSGNELLMFKLTLKKPNDKKTTIIFKDPKKMFSISISEACKVFGIIEGKHDFNHDEVDEVYMNGTFDEYIKKNRERILNYVRQDGTLLEQITNCIKELYIKENINIYSTLTRSVASSISWQKTIEQYKILKDVTLSPYAEICGGVRYNDIMDHAIGGRTQCVQSGTFQNICGIDVNSMYPYVCANREYPCGQIIEISESTLQRKISGTDIPRDKLGVYLVRIKKQSYPHVIPYRRSKHYAYNWEFTDKPFEKWITSIDMDQVEDCEIIKGFYWTDKTDKFYKDFMIDNYNERISIEKSDPRNLHIKLKMNGVTGSVFQHSFRELIMILGKDEFTETMKRYSQLVTVIGCDSLNDKEYIVTMRPVRLREGDSRIKAQRDFCKGAITQKPWVLTMFTYSYARKVLRDEWIRLEQRGCKVIYCDTDSLFFVNPFTTLPDGRVDTRNFVVKKEEYINKDKDLGRWNIECWNDEGSFHTPKVYAIKNIGKLRIKGVGYNSLVTDTEYSNSDLNYEQKLKMFLECANNPPCDLHKDTYCTECPKRNNIHPSYRHVKELIEGKPLKTINFIMEKSSQYGIQKKYEIKIIR
jgi:hypothetical protein